MNLQVAIDASTRLVIAVGDPQPGNRNDTVVYRTSGINQKLCGRTVMADGGYRGNPEVIMPYRKSFRHRQPPQHQPHRLTNGPAPGNAFTQLRDVP